MTATSATPTAPASTSATPTPQRILDALLAGNRRFVSDAPEHPNQDVVRRAEITPAQKPVAVLLGCSDSRVAAEIIFDQGLGDLFVVRTAGHVLGPEVLGTIEYGTSILSCPLVIVLGHDSCGAIAAAGDAVENGLNVTGYVRDVVQHVMPSILSARAAGAAGGDEVIDAHIRNTVDLLLARSQVLADQVRSGQAAVVGLAYQLVDGAVRLVTSRGLPSDGATTAAHPEG